MATDLQSQNHGGVIPFDPAKLAAALTRTARDAVPLAGFIKMDKTGVWCHGIEAEEIEEGQQFMVNPQGFQHGYICWADEGSDKLGENTAPVTDAIAAPGPVPPGGRGWEYQLGLHFRGYKGGLDGQEFVFRSSSVGGKRAIGALMQLVGAKLTPQNGKVERDIVPVVTLASDSYKHKAYGKIFVPEINIVKWVPMPVEKTAAEAPAVNGKGSPRAPRKR